MGKHVSLPNQMMANITSQPQGMIIELAATKTVVQFCTESIIHVSVSPNPPVKKEPSLIVTTRAEKPEPDFIIKEREITLALNRLQVSVNLQTGSLTFLDKNSQVLLQEPTEKARVLQPENVADEATFSATQTFLLNSREALYGLGQFQDGVMNYRGHEMLLVQANQIVAVPFLVSTEGYGILWDNYSATKFSAKDNKMTWQAEVADTIAYYFVYGPSLDEVISGYRQLTGVAPLFGKWAYGYLQSKERYVDREDLLRTVQTFREMQIPLDVIIQDWRYWGELGWNAMEFDPSVFPEPSEMIRELHEKFHAKIMISIWPAFGASTNVYKELDAAGHLFPGEFWADGKVYDAFNAEARDIYWRWLKRGLFDCGIDAWWMDGTEPEFKSTENQTITSNEIKANQKNALGSWARYLNVFSLMTTKGVYENQRATTESKRVCILTRSAFAGQQKYAAATWSGDITASWEVFQKQISAGLNFCLAGIPYWTTDIGAFFIKKNYPNGCQDPNYQELFVRWFQYGTFCPLFRTHGTDTPREPWHFGAPGSPVFDTLVKFNQLRHRLLPYIYSLAWQVTRGYTLMRGLVMDFQNDPKVRQIEDQFMFGPALLVSPVTRPGATQSAPEVIPAENLLDKNGKPGGLDGNYFAGKNFETPKFSRKDPVIHFNWGQEMPPAGISPLEFSVRWEGFLLTRDAGEYAFSTTAYDGVKMWLDDQLVIDDWKNKPEGSLTDKIQLEANQKYKLKIHFSENTTSVHLKISWIPPQKKTKRQMQPSSRELYLPKSTWYDFWTGQTFAGKQQITVTAPLETMPLFVRAGSILPLGPLVQYATEKPADPIELRIYPGADGEFTLYEDENDNYNYEQGQYALIQFKWENASQTLTIGECQGNFPGMLQERTFEITRVGKNRSVSLEATPHPEKVVKYSGKTVKVMF